MYIAESIANSLYQKRILIREAGESVISGGDLEDKIYAKKVNKGDKFKLKNSVYYGALTLPKNTDPKSLSKYGFKVEVEDGDYIEVSINKGTELIFMGVVGGPGGGPSFKVDGYKENLVFSDLSEIDFLMVGGAGKAVKRIKITADIQVSDKGINYNDFYKDIAKVLDSNKAVVDYEFSGSQKNM